MAPMLLRWSVPVSPNREYIVSFVVACKICQYDGDLIQGLPENGKSNLRNNCSRI